LELRAERLRARHRVWHGASVALVAVAGIDLLAVLLAEASGLRVGILIEGSCLLAASWARCPLNVTLVCRARRVDRARLAVRLGDWTRRASRAGIIDAAIVARAGVRGHNNVGGQAAAGDTFACGLDVACAHWAAGERRTRTLRLRTARAVRKRRRSTHAAGIALFVLHASRTRSGHNSRRGRHASLVAARRTLGVLPRAAFERWADRRCLARRLSGLASAAV